MVCYFMVSQRGVGRSSRIAGPSTYNQRIERLWHDVYHCIASTYQGLFYHMEGEHLLDPACEMDLFVLHCVFLPHINQSLESFTQAWNQHPIRTERMWCPKTIWINGVVRSNTEGHHIACGVDPIPEDLANFGIDPSGPVPDEHREVTVPDTICPLDDKAKQRFLDCLHLMYSDPSPPSDYGLALRPKAYSLTCLRMLILQKTSGCIVSSYIALYGHFPMFFFYTLLSHNKWATSIQQHYST